MTELNLDEMDLRELKALKKNVDKAIVSFEDRQKQAALAALEATAKEHGFKLGELMNAPKGKAIAPPKYRHPENESLTWTGRGRQPAWYKEAIENGVDEADLLI